MVTASVRHCCHCVAVEPTDSSPQKCNIHACHDAFLAGVLQCGSSAWRVTPTGPNHVRVICKSFPIFKMLSASPGRSTGGFGGGGIFYGLRSSLTLPAPRGALDTRLIRLLSVAQFRRSLRSPETACIKTGGGRPLARTCMVTHRKLPSCAFTALRNETRGAGGGGGVTRSRNHILCRGEAPT